MFRSEGFLPNNLNDSDDFEEIKNNENEERGDEEGEKGKEEEEEEEDSCDEYHSNNIEGNENNTRNFHARNTNKFQTIFFFEGRILNKSDHKNNSKQWQNRNGTITC